MATGNKPTKKKKEIALLMVNNKQRRYSYCKPGQTPPDGWQITAMTQRDASMYNLIYEPFPFQEVTR